MTLTNSRTLKVTPILATIPRVPLMEPGANEVEAVGMGLDVIGAVPDWTYSVTAEDNGVAGVLDLQPGLTYDGPSGAHVRVVLLEFDTFEHPIDPPEASDSATLSVYVNSELADINSRGASSHVSEIAVEASMDIMVGPINEGDVIRVAYRFDGEEADADLVLENGGTLSIT